MNEYKIYGYCLFMIISSSNPCTPACAIAAFTILKVHTTVSTMTVFSKVH